jgi:hypothetical protein
MRLKRQYRSKMLIVASCLVVLNFSCKKFVEISPPDTQIVTASVFNNTSAVTASLLSIYTKMVSNNQSWAISQDQGLLADELTTFSTSSAMIQFYTNSMAAASNNGPWNLAYNYIYQANAIIEGLQNNAYINPAIAQQLTGEAKFIRAFWHFYLANIYGDVPLVTTTAYTVNELMARTARAQVYNQIIKDLQNAQVLLNANYVDASDTAQTTDRIRPNKSVASALLARVYLFTGQYDSAQAQATSVINNTMLYSLCANLSGSNSVFLMNSTEAIWQLGVPNPPPVSSNTPDANYFILTAAPGTGTGNSCIISTQLLNAFEPGDHRKTNWIGVYTGTNPAANYYFPYKYKSYNTSKVTEYTMVLRLAEQYLIRAEAEAQQGNTNGAVADLNVIRLRAGLQAYSGATDLASLLAAILHERQVELFTEWGHRWFDLIRTGAVNTVMGSPGNVCQAKGGTWNSDWQLYPIPQSEIVNDANLQQNPGY